MPRTLQEILDNQNELAKKFEDYEPSPDDERDPAAFKRLMAATVNRGQAEVELAAAVEAARVAGYSWAAIGGVVGTTGQAAQQRYGTKLPR